MRRKKKHPIISQRAARQAYADLGVVNKMLEEQRDAARELEQDNARLKGTLDRQLQSLSELRMREQAAKTRLGRARNLGPIAQGDVPDELIAKCQAAVALGFKPTLSIGFGFAGDAQTPTLELWAEEILS